MSKQGQQAISKTELTVGGCGCGPTNNHLPSSISPDSEILRPSLLEALPDRLEAARDNYYRQLSQQMKSFGAGGFSPSFVISNLKLWTPGQVIRIAFMGGTDVLRQQIADAASEWTLHANLILEFKDPTTGAFYEWSPAVTTYSGDIRISFDKPGYYSMVGTDSVSAAPANMESMNFGGFDTSLPSSYAATVLHEFGHALGFQHEHQHPIQGCESEFRWDDDIGYVQTKDSAGCWYIADSKGRRPGIYTVLGGCPNYWNKSKVDFNLRQLAPSSSYSLSSFDPSSIMKYYFDAWMFKSGIASPCFSPRNTTLSAQDKLGASTVYPQAADISQDLLNQRASIIALMAGNSPLESPIRKLAAMQAQQLPQLAQEFSDKSNFNSPTPQTIIQQSGGESSVVPRFHEDLFSPNENPLMDLSEASGVAFNVVDGGYEAPPTVPWKLFRGNATDVWFFAPSLGRIASRPDGSPALTLTAKVTNNPDGSRTWIGGTLSFLMQVTQEIPSTDVIKSWHDLLKSQGLVPRGASFQFQPLPLTQGRLNVYGIEGKVVPGGQPTRDVPIGASSAIAFAINLTGDAARDYYVAMKSRSQIPPQVAVVCSFRYQKLLPTCKIRMFGSKKKTYDYFSDSLKARASYWGLVSASFERSRVRVDLRNEGAFTLDVIGTPPAGIDIAKLTDAMTDKFLLKEAGEWIKPDPTPAEASAPGGYFGGVSYSMKSVNISASETFSGEINVADLVLEPHDISFNFETAMSQLDPEKHAFLIEDDRKLDLKLVIGDCPMILQSTSVASYMRGDSPVRVNVPDLPSSGGITSGIMQWTQGLEPKPTSAELESAFIFKSPYPSYIVKRKIPVSDSGAVLAIFPDNFVQRSSLIFIFDGSSTDNLAICQWKFTPPAGSTSLPVSRVVRIGGDPLPGNLPSTEIIFPLKEEDVLNGGKIEVKVKGLRGAWVGKETPTMKLDLGQSSLAIDWSGELKL